MSETAIMQDIRLALGACPGIKAWRNNVGMFKEQKSGRWIRYGLFNGSADIIGLKTVTITPEMVGQKVAVFLSVEVKTPQAPKKLPDDQQAWFDAVQKAGGIAVIARSVEDVNFLLAD